MSYDMTNFDTSLKKKKKNLHIKTVKRSRFTKDLLPPLPAAFFHFFFFFFSVSIDTSCCCRLPPITTSPPPLHPIAPPHRRETHRNHHGTGNNPRVRFFVNHKTILLLDCCRCRGDFDGSHGDVVVRWVVSQRMGFTGWGMVKGVGHGGGAMGWRGGGKVVIGGRRQAAAAGGINGN
jgi:hypothetical protein